MNTNGYTLIELLVVIAVVAILAVALGFSYVGWQGKYRVDSQIEQLYTDMMNARARAMQRARTQFLFFPDARSYSMYADTFDASPANSPEGDGALQTAGGNTDTLIAGFPRTTDYTLTFGGVGAPYTLEFDKRGLVVQNITLCMFTDLDADKVSDLDPDYDCIIVSDTRINRGKLDKQDTDGGACDATNCQAR